MQVFIVAALKCEVLFLIDKYSLQDIKDDRFSIFEKDNIKLIISGVGIINSSIATTYLLSKNKVSSLDKIINFGICGCSDIEMNIGSIVGIKSVIHQNKKYNINTHYDEINLEKITCMDYGIDDMKDINTKLVDMESFGFLSASKKFINPKNIYLYKVISDFLEPNKVDKDLVTKITSSMNYDFIKVG